jgi:hypothetical protein
MGRTACTEPQCLYKGDLYLFPFFIPTLPGCRWLLLHVITHMVTYTLCTTPLGEGSSRRRSLTRVTYIYKGKTSMPPKDFKPSIPASVRPTRWAITLYAVYQYRQLCQTRANKGRLARVRTVAISRGGY